MSALEVHDLVIRYPKRPDPAVDGLSLQADAGHVTALLGPNGAGKTSAIETCVGLRTPTSGTVETLGSTNLQDPELRARVGIMLQDGGLPTGAKPVALLRHLAGLYRNPLNVTELAERLGITAFAGTTVRRLSGGQKQRVSLAAAIIGQPELVFLDEPTAGLDPQASLVVHQIIRELIADGVAVVLTTHDMDDAATLADQVLIVDHGRTVAHGSPIELTGGGGSSIRLVLTQELPALAIPGITISETRPGTYQLTGTVTTDTLLAVTMRLRSRGIEPVELSLRRPTLEDVFLDLTGRSLR